jgi:AraC family transcriptional regulator
MAEIEVKIVKLEPMRIASVYAFGLSPEAEAWKKLTAWAKPKGLLNNIKRQQLFGFNNPNPCDECSKYGYELWIKVNSAIEPEGDIRIIDFCGGPYAVCRCEAKGDLQVKVPNAWLNITEWCHNNNHKLGYHQALENFITSADDPDTLVLDLYCPILE